MLEKEIEQYARECHGSYEESLIKKWLKESLGIFSRLGIIAPSIDDYRRHEDALRSEMLNTLSGRDSGSKISLGQVNKILRETRKYLKWLQGGQMSMEFEDKDTELGASASTSSEPLLGSSLLPASSVASEELSSSVDTESEEALGVSAEATDGGESLGALSESIADDVMPESGGAKSEPPLKRGRKVKPASEKRSVKMSIYLTPRVYEGMKTLASATQQDVSDIFFSLCEDFVVRNSEKISHIQSFFASLGAIK